jgi:hypothetical protein
MSVANRSLNMPPPARFSKNAGPPTVKQQAAAQKALLARRAAASAAGGGGATMTPSTSEQALSEKVKQLVARRSQQHARVDAGRHAAVTKRPAPSVADEQRAAASTTPVTSIDDKSSSES